MMTRTLDAVFEQGVFRPVIPLDIAVPEGQQVRLVVQVPDSPTDVLMIATQVYEGLSEKQIDEIEQIILDRRNFFGDRMLA